MSVSDQYTAYLRDVANTGMRHETSRRFYFTLLSGLSVFLSLSGPDGPISAVEGPTMVLVGLAGCGLCYLWHIHMLSYRAIFHAKFEVLKAIEVQEQLFPLFGVEGTELKKHNDYIQLTRMDSLPPIVFALLIAAITVVLMVKQVSGPAAAG